MLNYPEDWKTQPLGKCVDIYQGGTPKTSTASYWGGKIVWLTPGEITKIKGLYVDNSERKITEQGLKNSSACLLPEGAILLCTRATIGDLAIAKVPLATNQGFKNLVCYSNIDNVFLSYLLRTKKEEMMERAIGTTFLEISKKELSKIIIAFPELQEQRAIAEALTSVDTHIANLTELIEKKKAIRDGALEDLVSGRVRLEGFSKKWHCNPLNKLGTFVKGAPLSKADITESGTPLILYGELYTTYGDVVHNVIHRTNACVEQKYLSVTGDVIIPTSGETAEEIATAACVMQDGVILGGDLMIIKTHKSLVDGRFLSYLINHVVNRAIADIAQGISVIHIKPKEVSRIDILYPDIDEQLAIADVIETMDAEIASLEDECDKMRQIKAGMMGDLLTGRVRLIG